jgi:predicted NBD/HSP70 family sugar kinase
LIVGIDVGGTKIQFAVYDGEQVKILNKENTPDSYHDFLDLVSRVLAQDAGKRVKRVGIGIPGTYTNEKVTWVPNIPYLENQNLVGDLSRLLGVEVVIANDAQLALLGEVWQGAGRGKQDAILMSIGTGIGGAIMVRDKLIRGRRGAAGALGWLNLDYSHPADKNHGYLELHASGTALEKIGQAMVPPLTSFQIVERARAGNEQCLKVIKHIGYLIGTAFASIGSVLDTEILIVSGGLSKEFDLFEDSINNSFQGSAAPGISEVPIVKSQLENLSGVYGAIRLAIIE